MSENAPRRPIRPEPAAMGPPRGRRTAAATAGCGRPGLVGLQPSGQARPDPGRGRQQRQDPDRSPADGRRTSLDRVPHQPEAGDHQARLDPDRHEGRHWRAEERRLLRRPHDPLGRSPARSSPPARTSPCADRSQLVSNSAASTTMRYISEEVVAAAATSLGNQTTQGYLKNVYDGFNQIAKSNKSAASSAESLANGTAQVSEGAAQLDDGTSELADSLGQVASGSASLQSGTASVASGAAKVEQGVAGVSNGAGKLHNGAAQLANSSRTLAKDSGVLADKAGKVATAGAGVSAATTRLAGANRALAEQLNQLTDGVSDGRWVGAVVRPADAGEGPCGRGSCWLRTSQPVGGQGRDGRGRDSQGCWRDCPGQQPALPWARRSAVRAASSVARRRRAHRCRLGRERCSHHQRRGSPARERHTADLIRGDLARLRERLGQLGGQLDQQRGSAAQQRTGEGRQGSPTYSSPSRMRSP